MGVVNNARVLRLKCMRLIDLISKKSRFYRIDFPCSHFTGKLLFLYHWYTWKRRSVLNVDSRKWDKDCSTVSRYKMNFYLTTYIAVLYPISNHNTASENHGVLILKKIDSTLTYNASFKCLLFRLRVFKLVFLCPNVFCSKMHI